VSRCWAADQRGCIACTYVCSMLAAARHRPNSRTFERRSKVFSFCAPGMPPCRTRRRRRMQTGPVSLPPVAELPGPSHRNPARAVRGPLRHGSAIGRCRRQRQLFFFFSRLGKADINMVRGFLALVLAGALTVAGRAGGHPRPRSVTTPAALPAAADSQMAVHLVAHQRRPPKSAGCCGQRLRLLRLRGAGAVAATGHCPKYDIKGEAPAPTSVPLPLRAIARVGDDACESRAGRSLLGAPAGVLRLRGGLKGRRRKASGYLWRR